MIETLEIVASEDEYSSYKKLQRELEYINLQEEYIKDEQRFVASSNYYNHFSCSV